MFEDLVGIAIVKAITRWPNVTYERGRVCLEPHCDTILSRYNSTSWCGVHESAAAWELPYSSSGQRTGRAGKPAKR